MQRLVLALLFVAAVIGLAAWVLRGLRGTAGGPKVDDGTTPMQRVAYFVLIALMLYVAVAGSGA